MMDLASAAGIVSGQLVGPNARFRRVVTDSRALEPGDLFVALVGERFDGHDFVARVLASGAAGAMVAAGRFEALKATAGAGGALLAVDDTLASLGQLAAAWRSRFTLPVVLVVGSNGKTTVKEMTAAILARHFGDEHVLATRGNLNNAIGLPLTLLRLRESHRAAVIELGMNHRGETAELAPLVAASVVIVNNAQREHLEFLAGIDEVATEHADALCTLRPGGTAVLNADDAHCEHWAAVAEQHAARVLRFGFAPEADIHGEVESHVDRSEIMLRTPAGNAFIELHVPGVHMARNALAAAAAASAIGVPLSCVVSGLDAFRAVRGRLTVHEGTLGVRVIDDSYNANPDSVRAAIDVLVRAGGERWLVLGDMGEIGTQGPAFHREIGGYARMAGINRLYAAGDAAREAVEAFGHDAAWHGGDVEALAVRVRDDARAGITVLVKGSRFMGMERVVAALLDQAAAGGH